MKTLEQYAALIPTPAYVKPKEVWTGTRAGVTKEFNSWIEAYNFSTYKNRRKNYTYVGMTNRNEVDAYNQKCKERLEYIETIMKHDFRKFYNDLTSTEFDLCYARAQKRTRVKTRIFVNMEEEVTKMRAAKTVKTCLAPLPDEVLNGAHIVLKAAKTITRQMEMETA